MVLEWKEICGGMASMGSKSSTHAQTPYPAVLRLKSQASSDLQPRRMSAFCRPDLTLACTMSNGKNNLLYHKHPNEHSHE